MNQSSFVYCIMVLLILINLILHQIFWDQYFSFKFLKVLGSLASAASGSTVQWDRGQAQARGAQIRTQIQGRPQSLGEYGWFCNSIILKASL